MTRGFRVALIGLAAFAMLAGALGGCGGGGTSSTGGGPSLSAANTSHGSEGSSGSESSEGSGSPADSNGEAVGSQSLKCPSTERLQTTLGLPVSWTVQQREELPRDGAFEKGAEKSAYKRYCVYDSSDHNSFLYLVFADYPIEVAREEIAALQHHEVGCVEPSLCWRDNDQEGTNPEAGVIEDSRSFVAWDTSPPPEGDYSVPYTSEIDAGAATEGTLCLLPLELPNRLAADSEPELQTAFAGLQQFVREACGLSASGDEEAERESSEGASGLAGTTDDVSGAEQTYMAYSRALGEADYETACELVVQKFAEKLPEPCPDFLEKQVFRGRKLSPRQMTEMEAKVSESIALELESGEVLWVDGEWLVDPEAVEEGINE